MASEEDSKERAKSDGKPKIRGPFMRLLDRRIRDMRVEDPQEHAHKRLANVMRNFADVGKGEEKEVRAAAALIALEHNLGESVMTLLAGMEEQALLADLKVALRNLTSETTKVTNAIDGLEFQMRMVDSTMDSVGSSVDDVNTSLGSVNSTLIDVHESTSSTVNALAAVVAALGEVKAAVDQNRTVTERLEGTIIRLDKEANDAHGREGALNLRLTLAGLALAAVSLGGLSFDCRSLGLAEKQYAEQKSDMAGADQLKVLKQIRDEQKRSSTNRFDPVIRFRLP